MDRATIKKYAPQARRDFREAVKGRLALFGIRETNDGYEVDRLHRQGDSVVIGGRPYPRSVGEKRDLLEKAVKNDGYDQTIERLAYTWFNRLVAIRYMELHGYLDHGYRVLSHPSGEALPEILEHAEHVSLPSLDKNLVVELKLDGNRDEELYRLLLIAQCNALHSAMPFLFERVDDETELALPESLLNSNSPLRRLATEMPDDTWQEIEIIGWLYQSYISEKKAEVIGSVVKSEDIPAATQLFTPNWIVKFLVHNTLGKTWTRSHPSSGVRSQLSFLLDHPDRSHHLETPDDSTFLDPSCGSGHILVEAYDIYKAIYLDIGYRLADIPQVILSRNLVGMEIDNRASQLASFALCMKARADDPRFFASHAICPQIITIQPADHIQESNAAEALGSDCGADSLQTIRDLLAVFRNARTLGSLIEVPDALATRVAVLEQQLLRKVQTGGDLGSQYARELLTVTRQALALSRRYTFVVTNPPYMGTKGMNPELKRLAGDEFPLGKADLYGMFIQRLCMMVAPGGRLGLMTPFTWMFIKSYQELREYILSECTLSSLVQPEYHAFFESAFVPICAFTLTRIPPREDDRGCFISLERFPSQEDQETRTLEGIRDAKCPWRFETRLADLRLVPGSPLAYWASDTLRSAFRMGRPLAELAEPRQGMATADNDRFLRRWAEVSLAGIGFRLSDRGLAAASGKRWFPYNKGGAYRKWYGNNEYVVDWANDGAAIRSFVPRAVIRNPSYFFRKAITWTSTSSSYFGVRHADQGFLFDTKGSSCFASVELHDVLLGFLASNLVFRFLRMLNPTIEYQIGDISRLPVHPELLRETPLTQKIRSQVQECVRIARIDWNLVETSWDFEVLHLLSSENPSSTIAESVSRFELGRKHRVSTMLQIERELNQSLADVYGLAEGDVADIDPDSITLRSLSRTDSTNLLVSYATGCMMGRYSLDKPGLIYANAGGEGFDPSKYVTFRADDDGILPVTEADWGLPDDVAKRFEEFVGVAWTKESLEGNLAFVAESLDPKKGETSREAIRRYLATAFYKHHLQMYKRRPIYWLFSSGKLRAFQCLVYLHRYNEGTLSRMRTEYVIPLQGRITGRIQQLEEDKLKPSSTAHGKQLQKKLDGLKKEEVELRAFEEKLKHYADRRITLDLDDGVKVNYGKFGDLLADVKAVTGGSEE